MKTFAAVIVLFVGAVIGLGVYLSPDDLRTCSGPDNTSDHCARADAIVAVSGGDTSARTQEAIKLYNEGWAPKLVFSGAAHDKSGPSNAEVMRREAVQEGVPLSAIVIEEYSTTTKENAEKARDIFASNNINSVILVTSAYHQRRAGIEFSSRLQSIQVRNHPVAQDRQWSRVWWLTPTGWYLAISEIGKIIVIQTGGERYG